MNLSLDLRRAVREVARRQWLDGKPWVVRREDVPDVTCAVYVALTSGGHPRYVGSAHRRKGSVRHRIAEHVLAHPERRDWWVWIVVIPIFENVPVAILHILENRVGMTLGGTASLQDLRALPAYNPQMDSFRTTYLRRAIHASTTALDEVRRSSEHHR